MKVKKATIIKKKLDGEIVELNVKTFSVQESQFKVIDEEKGIFEAYVSVFGNKDSYGDVVEKGAFKEWLEIHKGRYPKGVWMHNWSEPIIKTLEIFEDDYGLKVRGQFVLEVQRAREAYALMKEGVLTDFSFGYRVQEDSWDEVAKVRRLKKIAIYEYSPVLVGANDQATLQSVKSAEGAVEEDAPENDDTTASEPAPVEETPSPEAASEAEPTPEDDGESPSEPEVIPDSPSEDGKGLAPSKKSAIAIAVDALRKAADALEAAETATEADEPDEPSQDSEEVEEQSGKGNGDRNVVKAILRDARKADKILEKVIIRAKTITK